MATAYRVHLLLHGKQIGQGELLIDLPEFAAAPLVLQIEQAINCMTGTRCHIETITERATENVDSKRPTD